MPSSISPQSSLVTLMVQRFLPVIELETYNVQALTECFSTLIELKSHGG